MESELYQADPERFRFQTGKGLNEEVVRTISRAKDEPAWMLEFRLKSYRHFLAKPIPTWGPDLSPLNLDDITYYARPDADTAKTWDDVPEEIKRTYERIGIPQAEQRFLAGVVAQYESESIYENLKRPYENLGIIFTSLDQAVKEHPDLVRRYFMTKCVPPQDNKFAALHGAVWSGGSFVYVPAGVQVAIPLQAYFRMNAAQMGQFEHTLIIAEEGSSVHYIEGCTAPQYSLNSLHSAVVEIFVGKGAKVRYTTIQNWSKDVWNLNTKRALVEEDGVMEWVGGSLGSGVTMLYPGSYLIGRGARADHLNLSLAGTGQHKDTGAKVVHAAPYTTSRVISKSISVGGGWAGYRGLVQIGAGAVGSKASVRCDALILDDRSRSDTWPDLQIHQGETEVSHEATVGKVSEEQLFYLMSRGLKETEAMAMIVSGFIEPVSRELPMEYAVELNRLLTMEMEDAIG